MTHVVPFRTRARTVDHLGREQIADTPTAISELWKNAYDAYATHVEFHIFDKSQPGEENAVAAVVDNGHGMSSEEFIERWLVLGTEAKLAETETPEADRNGLPKRVRQGQKGIGRLSVARLGPLTLVLTKRTGSAITLALVDWRLFENPFLNLDDIFIPVETLRERSAAALARAFAGMMDALYDNVSAKKGKPSRNQRIDAAWERYDALSQTKGLPPPSERITESLTKSWITERHLKAWDVWQGEAEHGTALYVLDPDHELAVWTHARGSIEDEPKEVKETKELLQSTLRSFTDPFTTEAPQFLDYRVVVHRGEHESVVVDADSDFDIDGFHGLEHYIEGRFNEHAVFHGKVRAYGRPPEQFTFTPAVRLPTKGPGYVGPLDVLVGTFEQTAISSTHPPIKHADLVHKADKYGGVALYRDGLRVMPYGRLNADLFEMEERRSLHAGREFWAHRRTFGRVAFSQAENPNLRDKAGREGLIDNQARRELKLLIIGLLKETARKYFGSDSEARDKYLPDIEARNKAAKASDEKAQKRRVTAFRAAIRGQDTLLDTTIAELSTLETRLKAALTTGRVDTLLDLTTELERFKEVLGGLRLPPRPSRLPSKLEQDYRSYRDRYAKLRETGDALYQQWYQAIARLSPKSAEEQANSAFSRHQKHLHDKIAQRLRRTKDLLKAESQRWDEQAAGDRRAYYIEASPTLDDLANKKHDLPTVLTTLLDIQETLSQSIESRWDTYIRALEQLAEGLDLDEALRYSSEMREELEERVAQVHALAQLGVVIEIIGHELNDIEEEISRSMKRLSRVTQSSDQFKDAVGAQRKLFDQLRFLAPMLLAGRRLREEIRGDHIYAYTRAFFTRLLEDRTVTFTASPEFLALRLTEQPSRIQPVFLNIVNNAIYWVSMTRDGTKREIQLSVVDGAVVISDSGPGVDPDDLPRLFQLFFSRKPDGRGVGLYLCRTNLEMGGHSIEYATDLHFKKLSGANFVIRFKGISFG